jgi:transcriptional regulator with XRE-family HTH domain
MKSDTLKTQPLKLKSCKTICTQIQTLRNKMGYSIAEMAECLGLKKSTYQSYENGNRTAPDELIKQMKHYQKIGKEFSKNLPKSIDRAAKRMHPHGIISEVGEWE